MGSDTWRLVVLTAGRMAHLDVFSTSPQQGSKAAAHAVGPCLRMWVALLPEFGSWTVRVETVG